MLHAPQRPKRNDSLQNVQTIHQIFSKTERVLLFLLPLQVAHNRHRPPLPFLRLLLVVRHQKRLHVRRQLFQNQRHVHLVRRFHVPAFVQTPVHQHRFTVDNFHHRVHPSLLLLHRAATTTFLSLRVVHRRRGSSVDARSKGVQIPVFHQISNRSSV